MHVVWHAFETIGNTLIFLLAGLIIGESIWEGHNNTMVLGFSDWGYMLIFFGIMSAVRASMIIISFPILQRTGYGTTSGTILIHYTHTLHTLYFIQYSYCTHTVHTKLYSYCTH
jgi:NhaP-type Na+/H+ or K+/H+ antiporter